MKFLVINGVNLNMTGEREKGVYGNETLEEMEKDISCFICKHGDAVDFFQSNLEGEICSKIEDAYLSGAYNGILLNAGAYTHYSYAIRDAVSAVKVPVVEVHMSNVYVREDFRKISVISDVCIGSVSGFGKFSYFAAYIGLKEKLTNEENS